jgi:hypothetical protein
MMFKDCFRGYFVFEKILLKQTVSFWEESHNEIETTKQFYADTVVENMKIKMDEFDRILIYKRMN